MSGQAAERKHRFLSVGLLVVAGITHPLTVAAQSCIGVPTSNGALAFEGHVGFVDGLRILGVSLTGDLAGPASLFAGYDILHTTAETTRQIDRIEASFDKGLNGNGFTGGFAAELSVPSISLCPVAGFQYARFRESNGPGESETVSAVAIPIGLGIGKRLPASPHSPLIFT